MSTTAIQSTVDPIADSFTHLLAVCFAKTASPTYSLAVNLARGATKYEQISIEGKIHHLAAFAKNKSDAARAITTIDYISKWKGSQIFAEGRIITNIYEIRPTLECFLRASSCNDYRAHCFNIIDDPFTDLCDEQPNRVFTIRFQKEENPIKNIKEKVAFDRYSFPCSFLKNRHHFSFMRDHPASPEDQIQAGAVRAGCSWCPFFNPKNYKKIGVREELRPIQ